MTPTRVFARNPATAMPMKMRTIGNMVENELVADCRISGMPGSKDKPDHLLQFSSSRMLGRTNTSRKPPSTTPFHVGKLRTQ